MPRIDLKKKEYKILDFKGWVKHQMHLNKKKQKDVAEALGISPGRMSQMLDVPDAKDRNRKKKGEKLKIDVFSYGQVITLCEFFNVDEEERKKASHFVKTLICAKEEGKMKKYRVRYWGEDGAEEFMDFDGMGQAQQFYDSLDGKAEIYEWTPEESKYWLKVYPEFEY